MRVAFVGGRGWGRHGKRGWMRDEDEPSSPERLPGCPLYTPHREEGNSLGSSFVHVGGFPTPGWLPIPPQRGRKRMIGLMAKNRALNLFNWEEVHEKFEIN